MRRITKPTDDPETVFETCISKVRNPMLKSSLQAISSHIASEAVDYDILATQGLLHTILIHTHVLGIPADEMIRTYKSRMVQDGSPGRSIYNKIKAATEICPLCGQRPVSQLDHFLPESTYPTYSVLPYNLVPSCSDCNTIKSAHSSNNPSEQTLHPYYDNVVNDQWLYADILQTVPASISFRVSTPSNWSQVLQERVKFHFKTLLLNALFISQANVEISSIRSRLKKLLERTGSIGVHNHLKEEFLSRFDDHKNSWQTAMYEAMANSNWFCNGGFR